MTTSSQFDESSKFEKPVQLDTGRQIHPSNQTVSLPTHLPLFDEVAIALPHYIKTPILQIVATKIQQHMTQQTPKYYDGEVSSISLHQNSLKLNTAILEESGDIKHAKAILQHLLDTPNADASVLVAITNEPKPKLLLTRRAGHLNTHAGEVSFAGGKYDFDDGNNLVTALREACEETALPPSKVQIIGQLPIQIAKSGMQVRPIVALVDPNVIYVPELGEIALIFWADFAALVTEPIIDYEVSYTLSEGNQATFLTPSWIIDGETVWGLTGRIIASLLEICFERKTDWYYRLK